MKKIFIRKYFIFLMIVSILTFLLNGRLFYNNSPSVPVGFYFKENSSSSFNKGDIVFFQLDEKTFNFLKGHSLVEKDYKKPFIMKRIGAKQGDTILIKDKKLFINGKEIYRTIDIPEKNLITIPDLEYTLKEKEYFLIGDLDISFDSRYFGVVKEENLYLARTLYKCDVSSILKKN